MNKKEASGKRVWTLLGIEGQKKAAIEMSLTTIIVIVLGVTLLILGMILIRSIMCSALGLTSNINTKMTAELEKYFSETEDEVVCIGESDPVKMVPDSTKDSFIYCAVSAPLEAQYSFSVVDYGSSEGIKKEMIGSWIKEGTSTEKISPGDKSPKKVTRLRIPKDAPEGTVWFKVEIKKDGTLLRTKTLDYQVSRVGFVKAAMC